MRPHSILMAAATVAVLGLGVYLFIQVRSAPAAPQPKADRTAQVKEQPAPETSSPSPSAPTATVGKKRLDVVPHQPGEPVRAVITEVPSVPDQHADQAQDALMDQANKAYDHQEFDDARNFAGKVLAKDPTNIRMLRIMVSAACVEVDQAEATKWLAKLPVADQNAMKARCQRYGIAFGEPK